MMRDIERRLRKLESQIPRQPTEQEQIVERLQRFLFCAVAYYLGDPTPEGSVMEAYGRALGYPNSHEFRKAWDAKDPDLFQRDRLARIKLLEKFGVSRERESVAIAAALRRMEAGLPERSKACWGVDA